MYAYTLLAGFLIGLVAAVVFLAGYRPTSWRRLVTLDASGWVLAVLLTYARALVMLAASWPPVPPPAPTHGWLAAHPWAQVASLVLSLLILYAVDALVIVKLVNYRRFVRQNR